MKLLPINMVVLQRCLVVVAVLCLGVGIGFATYNLAYRTGSYLPAHDEMKRIAVHHGVTVPMNDTAQYPTEQPPHHDAVKAAIPTAVDSLAPVLTTIPTAEPVVYLGIDDGAYKDPSVVALIKKDHIKASLFLSDLFIASDPAFFKNITDHGSVVENHTTSHDTDMSTKSYEYQHQEICGMADKIEKYYGRRPTLFRPPGGAYSVTMQRAAHDCGMKAIITWIAKANGGSMQYQVGNGLRPGDIVLMHFRPEFAKDMAAFVAAQNAAGLHTELLEDLFE